MKHIDSRQQFYDVHPKSDFFQSESATNPLKINTFLDNREEGIKFILR